MKLSKDLNIDISALELCLKWHEALFAVLVSNNNARDSATIVTSNVNTGDGRLAIGKSSSLEMESTLDEVLRRLF
jgi:hypothetical protein